MEKTCFKCGASKAMTDFYPHPQMRDGHLNKCKDCSRADTAARTKLRDPSVVREEKRLWAASENGRASQRRYESENREKVRESQRQWSLSPNGRALQERIRQRPEYLEIRRKAKSTWNHRNRDKRRVHRQVKVAIERGLLDRKACEVCGDRESEAHHDDYAKALEVRWLCRIHHAEHHRIEKRARMATVAVRS